jgi:hypothetical protein
VLKSLFYLLRAGKTVEAQQILLEKNHHEKYLWLVGTIPQFDNVCYFEDIDYKDLLPNDLDREHNL